MSKSNDVSTLDHRPLADSELDAVSGGFFADYVKQLLANSEPFQKEPLPRGVVPHRRERH